MNNKPLMTLIFTAYFADLSDLKPMKILLIAFLGLVMLGCYPAPDTFGKLDTKAWRGDRRGCNGVRAKLVGGFRAEIEQFKGQSANNIGGILGGPDINQIADRNQKYYVYYLQPGPQCNDTKAQPSAPTVALRMSAMGVVTEITFQNGLP